MLDTVALQAFYPLKTVKLEILNLSNNFQILVLLLSYAKFI